MILLPPLEPWFDASFFDEDSLFIIIIIIIIIGGLYHLAAK
jgi:hypothetical protein